MSSTPEIESQIAPEDAVFPDDGMAQVIEETKIRILHALEVFPFISSSMLHQAIGTATSGRLWKPILEGLIEDGKVCCLEFPAKGAAGRAQTYTIYHLPKYPYTYGQVT
jgi:hypothetical protein